LGLAVDVGFAPPNLAGPPARETTRQVNGTLTATPEDARVYYTGLLYVATASPTSTSATVTLATTVKDITAVPGDLAWDA
jgi:hypothetical protein